MKCFYHPTDNAIQGCHTCSRLMCAACSHTIKGNIYCQDCLVQGAQMAHQETQQPVNTLVWGGALVLLGLVFLLDSLAIISFHFVRRFWPLAFVFLGLYMIYDHYRKQE